MALKEIFDFIGSVTPSLLQDWVAAWAEIFKNTFVMRPDADSQVVLTGMALATLFGVFFVLVFSGYSASLLRKIALSAAVVTFVLFVGCNVMRVSLAYQHSRETIELLKTVWDYLTIGFVFSMGLMVLFAAMSAFKAAVSAFKTPD
ncbi:MAG: hypothetical protein EOR99_06065 [Mesorhizobium sp.]|nr:MAG: hypothetical protein EOR99_06065 [Mesorhizobium sp.]